MRVEVSPRRLSAVPGRPAVVTVRVVNTGSVISGHSIRVLGVDPQWAVLDQESLSLFPDSSGVALLTVTLPAGIPAGSRALTVEVSELTPPAEVARVEVELAVPAEPNVTVAVDPPSVTGGNGAEVGLVIENTGNSVLDVDLLGRDEEGEVGFRFDPAMPTLAPGEALIGTAHLRAKRPWFGGPKIRPFTIEAGPPSAPVIAFGAWVQKPRLTRGAMALVGLLAVATIFAVVIAASLSQVVNKSTADRNLAIQVAQAGQSSSANAGTSGITGTVNLLTSGAAVSGVTVELYQAANTATPILSTATDASGGYHFSGLAAGSYKLHFSGAGFSELWYPQALTPDIATPVNLVAGKTVPGVDMRLGGVPVVLSGQIMGGDAAGALLTLQIPPAAGASSAAAPAGQAGTSASAGPIIVATQILGSSGDFSLGNVPSPGLYQLVVTKLGYAPSVQQVDLGSGQARSDISISLHKGDGSVTGTVSSPSGPLGGATVSASDGTTTVSTVTVTTPGSVGTFTLSGLPTPDNLTLVVSDPGYATQTLALSLAAGQQLTGEAVTLTSGVGSVSGTVSTVDGAPAGGVTVTATNGQTSITTVTLSTGAIGTYTLSGLTVPSTYTVTFSRPDLASQTQALALTAVTSNATGINATMLSSSAAIYGVVSDAHGPVSEVAILLSSGSTSYKVTSASVPTAGAYEIDGVVPGTYTVSFTRPGGLPTSRIVTLTAGQRLQFDAVLNPAASIFGHVTLAGSQGKTPVPGTEVRLYLTSQYPTVVLVTAVTDSSGNFTISNVDAPQSFVVSFDYPAGSSPQETAVITTALGTATPVCGSQTTGTAGAAPTAPQTTCNPAADPVQVTTQ
ncbi:carboxypeptidase-like regulatory domain-containing protein [Acidiferrimicrobium sp. IK]|uniref:carboxypeptidase-like regulatory domain-containing protein n=1 Tax=Acidiferrimicrobium sp. IK TaxID=2871700 RepID=UPI0021CAF00A|nr:carboxypeptidase-like regulatory domain-containing protein [Acidiferrimicrobium sp. IK]MCU4186054.1 carboxypeptidase-like regulatory domain-containing protein [Acidiferrimicrobium sp. IK]